MSGASERGNKYKRIMTTTTSAAATRGGGGGQTECLVAPFAYELPYNSFKFVL